jgi:hypothetical protein
MHAFSTTRRVRVFLESLITALKNMERPTSGPSEVKGATALALIPDRSPDRNSDCNPDCNRSRSIRFTPRDPDRR